MLLQSTKQAAQSSTQIETCASETKIDESGIYPSTPADPLGPE